MKACDVIMGKDERYLIKIKFYENYDKIEKKPEAKKCLKNSAQLLMKHNRFSCVIYFNLLSLWITQIGL